MKADRSEFEPRYSRSTRVLIYGLPTVFFSLLFLAGTSRLSASIYLWLVIFLLGALTSLLPFFLIRKIFFMKEIVVRRRFLPDQFITPAEFEGVLNNSILASGKRIRIGRMENLDGLSDMARRWSAGKKEEYPVTDPAPSKPIYPTTGYGQYASFWGLIFGVISIFVIPDIFAVDPRWIMGGTFLGVYLIYMYILPRVI